MDLEYSIWGLIAFLCGLIGLMIDGRKSYKEKKAEGWSYSRTKFVMSSWMLLGVGVILIIYSLRKPCKKSDGVF
jgi:hypothetical protein